VILLDTHVVVWLAVSPQRIQRKAQSAIRRAQALGGVGISAATFWELADVAAKQRVRITTTPEAWVRRLLEMTQVAVRDLTIEIP
jgi:PIN domain nuclease of toxin-antitoxin system